MLKFEAVRKQGDIKSIVIINIANVKAADSLAQNLTLICPEGCPDEGKVSIDVTLGPIGWDDLTQVCCDGMRQLFRQELARISTDGTLK